MTNKRLRLSIILIFAVILWWIVSAMLLPKGGAGKMSVQIPRGSSAEQIGHILSEKNVIRSAFGFRLLARLTRSSAGLKPGEYELEPSMSPLDIIRKIRKGETSARWVTFPEGFTVQQIAEHLAAEGFANEERFMEMARHGGRQFHTGFSHPGENLEGYLFPDTYMIPSGTSEEAIIGLMLKCFENKAAIPYASDAAKSGMSLQEIVTLASLIEREARIPKDRPLISAVLHNRLRMKMRLDIDATVLYALGKHKTRVLYRDLEVDSPYNTYRNAGLPPGPIANPGLDSIKAALHPAAVDYLYYVARKDGSHIFSRTLAEHEHAKSIARR